MMRRGEDDEEDVRQERADINDLREALGTIIASFTYVYDPFAIVKEVDILISYEIAMLDAIGKLDMIADKKANMTYRELFTNFRKEWKKAVDIYNQVTGNWKESIMICSGLRDNLFRIAVKERLITITKDMYNISSVMQQQSGSGNVIADDSTPPG